MRRLLWLLLALNGVAAALWLAGFRLPPPLADTAPLAQSARPLQLLSELPVLPPRLDSPSAQDGTATTGPDALPAAAATLPESEPGTAPETAASTGDDVAVQSGAAAPPATPGSAPGTAPDAAAAQSNPSPVSTGIETPAPAQGLICYRSGPFTGDTYEAAGSALREAGLGEPILQAQDGTRSRYWVYWDGSGDELAAVEAKLKSAGVRDWYRVRGGDSGTRLSLGVYGQLDGARRRQRELAAKTVSAQVSERYRPQARLRWTVTTTPAAVQAAKERLQTQGVALEVCP